MAFLSSFIDRYFLATSQCANPDAVVVVASFSGHVGTLLPTIEKNVPVLLRSFPLLSAAVLDRATRQARFVPAKNITVDKIVDSEIQSTTSIQDIYDREHDRNAVEFDPEQGPLWRVAFYNNLSASAPACYIALSCSHVINDGLGACELLRQVLRRPEINEAVEPSITANRFPPRIEDTITIPTPWHWLRDGFLSGLASNYLPASLNPYTPSPPNWPLTVAKRPIDCGIKRIILEGDRDDPGWLGSGLKSFGKITGAGSVNSIVHGALALSLYNAAKKREDLPDNLRLTAQTPISVRSSELGHPSTTGNYTNLGQFAFATSDLRSDNFTFHDLFSRYHGWMHSPAGRSVASNATGMMKFFDVLDLNRMTEWLPWYGTIKPKKLGNWILDTPPTAYERFCMRSRDLKFVDGKAPSPYKISFQLSNTGLVKTEELVPEAKENLKGMWWAQRPMPWGIAIYADVMGCEVLQNKVSDTDSAYSTASESSEEPIETIRTQLGISIAWRDGIVDNDLVTDFVDNLKEMLHLIACAGHQGKLASTILSKLSVMEFSKRLQESRDMT